jgi:hypothetical protein
MVEQQAFISRMQKLTAEMQEAETPSKQFELSTTISLLSILQNILPGITFPISREALASEAAINAAPQELVQRIKNARTRDFTDPEQVMDAVERPTAMDQG